MIINKNLINIVDLLEIQNKDFQVYSDGNILVDNHDDTYGMYFVDAFNQCHYEIIDYKTKRYLFN